MRIAVDDSARPPITQVNDIILLNLTHSCVAIFSRQSDRGPHPVLFQASDPLMMMQFSYLSCESEINPGCVVSHLSLTTSGAVGSLTSWTNTFFFDRAPVRMKAVSSRHNHTKLWTLVIGAYIALASLAFAASAFNYVHLKCVWLKSGTLQCLTPETKPCQNCSTLSWEKICVGCDTGVLGRTHPHFQLVYIRSTPQLV